MAKLLDELVGWLVSGRALDENLEQAARATQEFCKSCGDFRRTSDLARILGEFLNLLDFHILHLSSPLECNPSYARIRGFQVLNEVYGPTGSHVGAQALQSGAGQFGILREVADHVAREYARNEIRARIHSFNAALSTEFKIMAATYFVERWGRDLLPGDTARVRSMADLPQALEKLSELAAGMRHMMPE